MFKKILKIVGISLLVLIVLAFTLPYIFKGKIVALVKTEINQQLNATVDFKDVDISIFRHFPKLAVGLNNLQIVGKGEFAEDTLLQAQQIDVALDLMSAIKGKDIKIYNIVLKQPQVNAVVHANGLANWDIVKPDSTATADTTANNLQLNLEKYSIENGTVWYRDDASAMTAKVTNLNHQGKGNFIADVFTVATSTTADAVDFSYGGIPYLNQVKTSIDAAIEVDTKNSKYSFNTEKVQLNELQLITQGFLQLVNDSTYAMDINFKAPSTDFKNILSFVPAIYQNNFSSIKTSGQAIFNGFVKGNYNSTTIPAYNIHLDVKNGYFKYPDLPKAVQNINLTMQVDNPDGVTDHTVVNIPQAHIEFGADPFDFRLLVKNPITNMFVDAAAKGVLDLSSITQFVKLQSGTTLKGILNANASMSGNVSSIEKQQYNKMNAAGTIGLNAFKYASTDYPTGVELKNLLMTFTPKNVTLNNVAGNFMHTNFTANGYVNNLLEYALQNKALDGAVNLTADKINLNEWMGVSTDSSNKNTATSKPFIVPDNLNFLVNAKAQEVVYDKLNIQQLSGNLLIANETVTMNNVKGNALDGTVVISGSYSTKASKTKPDIALNYNVINVDIQKTFMAFNTVQKLMPIGKFLAGKLSSQLNLSGKLGNNMMPDLNTLSGLGNVLMLEGVLSSFQPLDKLSQTLNVNALKNISAKDIKAFFEFANGNVLVKPFTVKVKDIEMEIGGLHGLTQAMDYTINMKIPRASMGEKGNNLVNNLAQQISNQGVPVKVGDIVPIQVKMGGSILSPTIKTNLKQTTTSLAQDIKTQVTSFATAKADSAKAAIKDTLNSVKNEILKTAKDELTKKLLNKNDSSSISSPNDTKKNIEEKGKGLLKNLNPFKKKEKEQ
jgi:hypothetical protein